MCDHHWVSPESIIILDESHFPLESFLLQPMDPRLWYITYISVSMPTPWAVAGPNGQLANITYLRLESNAIPQYRVRMWACSYTTLTSYCKGSLAIQYWLKLPTILIFMHISWVLVDTYNYELMKTCSKLNKTNNCNSIHQYFFTYSRWFSSYMPALTSCTSTWISCSGFASNRNQQYTGFPLCSCPAKIHCWSKVMHIYNGNKILRLQ